jgi:hypothetical protein
MDAQFIKGMLSNPDVQPNAAMNQWIATIRLVADDSSLRQAIRLKLKGKAGLSRSSTKPDAETSHAPSLQDNIGVPQAIIPLFKVRKRSVTIGKCG